jgi:predicted ATPase
MARLDRIPEAKEVAQIAACIGREFSRDLLAAVTERPGAELDGALSKLAASGLVLRCGAPPGAGYAFKHALVRARSRRQWRASDGRILEPDRQLRGSPMPST